MNVSADTPEPTEPEPELPEITVEVPAAGEDDRSWLHAIGSLLSLRGGRPHPNPRVQWALEKLWIAAAERAVRILGSDLTETE